MKQKDYIEKEVQQTMQSLDGIERAKTDAFFYSRLQGRMEASTQIEYKKTNYTFAFSMAAMILLIVLNVISLASYPTNTNIEEDVEQVDMATEYLSDYELYDFGYYENVAED